MSSRDSIGRRVPVSLALLCATAVLVGCTTVGSGDFACPGRPTGVRCASATEVYAMTEGGDRIGSTSEDELGDDPKRAVAARQEQAGRIANAKGAADSDESPADQATTPAPPADHVQTEWLQASTGGTILPAVEKPIPVRTPAQVMRVWIAPWEDAKGVLHIGGYHFIEIHKRRWEIGEQHAFEPVRLFSIQEPFPESVNVGGEALAVPPVAAQASDTEQRKRQLRTNDD